MISTVALTLPKNVTGEYFTSDNCNKLFVKRCRYDLRKNFFSNRIVNMWNSLPDYVFMSDTINTFKNNIGNIESFFSLSSNVYRNRRLEIRIYVEYKKINVLLKMWT